MYHTLASIYSKVGSIRLKFSHSYIHNQIIDITNTRIKIRRLLPINSEKVSKRLDTLKTLKRDGKC